MTFWKAREENAWALDPDELKPLIRPETRAVVINTPHNPTGYLMRTTDQTALIEVVRAHDLLLFCDEVYRESEYDPARRLPAACDLDERAVSLGVLSKTYGLAGLRIGWIATRNHDIYRRMAALKDYTTICNSAPSEFLAALALRQREVLAARSLALIQRNLALAGRLASPATPSALPGCAPRPAPSPFRACATAKPPTFATAWSPRPGSCSCPVRSTTIREIISASASAAAACPKP